MEDGLLLGPAPAATIETELPIGFTDTHGQRQRIAALRKLRGSDEALFYDAALSGAELVTQLLRACLARLGTVAPVDGAHLEQLTSVDRNYLLFELRRVTFGDAWQAVYTCPACAGAVRVTEDLGAFPVRRLEGGEPIAEIAVELADGYCDRGGTCHRRMVVRLPRGHDEMHVARLAETDFLQARDALLVRCITAFGTLPRAVLESYGVKIVRELTLGDRRLLQDALDMATPGVDFRRRIDCPSCGLAFEAIADVTDFFGRS